MQEIKEGSIWFQRAVKDIQKMSSHFEFVPINYGWYRIYWTGGGEPAYVHELWKWMPYKGYINEDKDINLISKKYYEEYEDQLEVSRKVKNYVEGYFDTLDIMRTRNWMFRNDKAFRKEATQAYRKVVVK